MLSGVMSTVSRYLIVLGAVLLSVSALGNPAFYKYVDEQGVTHYTDNHDQIPAKYQGQIQVVDPTKVPLTIAPTPIPKETTAEQPFYASWSEEFSRSSLLLPSMYQVAVVCITLVMIFAIVKILSSTSRRFSRIVLKTVIAILLIVSSSALYLSRVPDGASSGASQHPAGRNVTGLDVIETMRQAGQFVERSLMDAPRVIGTLKDRTLGEQRTMEIIDPLALLGGVAVVIGLVGIYILYRKRKHGGTRLP
jgi:uncharacterized protein DUF4124